MTGLGKQLKMMMSRALSNAPSSQEESAKFSSSLKDMNSLKGSPSMFKSSPSLFNKSGNSRPNSLLVSVGDNTMSTTASSKMSVSKSDPEELFIRGQCTSM